MATAQKRTLTDLFQLASHGSVNVTNNGSVVTVSNAAGYFNADLHSVSLISVTADSICSSEAGSIGSHLAELGRVARQLERFLLS